MTEEEIELAHKRELRDMLRYWKNRALQSEKMLKIVSEIPNVALFLQERMKCESKNVDIKCSKCNCWKSKEIERATNEP